MNVLQMRGFNAQVEIMGKAVEVRFNGGTLTVEPLSLADAHTLLGQLATGAVKQEDGAALGIVGAEKKAAAPDATGGEVNDGTPPIAEATPEKVASPTAELTDAEVAASMRDELEADAPENPCDECGAELGSNDGSCIACTTHEDKGRRITERVRNRNKPGSAAKPKPAPQPEPDEPEEEAQVPEADDPLAPDNGVPEKLLGMMRLRQVVGYMMEQGIQGEEAIVKECMRIREQVPVLKRVRDLPGRVSRTLAMMDQASL